MGCPDIRDATRQCINSFGIVAEITALTLTHGGSWRSILRKVSHGLSFGSRNLPHMEPTSYLNGRCHHDKDMSFGTQPDGSDATVFWFSHQISWQNWIPPTIQRNIIVYRLGHLAEPFPPKADWRCPRHKKSSVLG